MQSILSALGGFAFFAMALFLHGRTSNPKLKWVAAGLALLGGAAVMRGSLDDGLIGVLANINIAVPAMVGAVAIAVAAIDLADGRPDKPATGALFLVPAFLKPLMAGLAHDNLTRAVVLALLAGIAAQREHETHEQIVKWTAVCLGMAAGVAFAQTGPAREIAHWLYPQLVGIIGLVALMTWGADMLDKKPGWAATAAGYVIPVSLPFTGALVASVVGS